MTSWNPFSVFPGFNAGATTPGSTAGTLTGATPKGYTSASGGVPAVPSPQTTQQQAIAGNQTALSGLTNLAGGVNQFNLGQVLSQYQAGVPGYSNMAAQSSANTADLLAGKIPADILANYGQNIAQSFGSTGLGGSGASNAAYAKALGLTSLGLKQQGEQALTGEVARMPRTGLYDLSQNFVSPGTQQESQYLANVLGAAPVPQDAFNQALLAAQYGQRTGYGTTRSPFASSLGGGATQMSPIQQILNKYSPTGGGASSYPANSASASPYLGSDIIGGNPYDESGGENPNLYYPDSYGYGQMAYGTGPDTVYTDQFGVPQVNYYPEF